jgi:hypothetical protein
MSYTSAIRFVDSRRFLFSLADNRPAMAGLVFRSQITGRSRMNVQAQIKSPLIGFGSLQRNPTEPAFFRRQPTSGSSRFNVLLTFLRYLRHSSSPAADVVRAGDRGSDPDHASPASFSVAFRYRSV